MFCQVPAYLEDTLQTILARIDLADGQLHHGGQEWRGPLQGIFQGCSTTVHLTRFTSQGRHHVTAQSCLPARSLHAAVFLEDFLTCILPLGLPLYQPQFGPFTHVHESTQQLLRRLPSWHHAGTSVETVHLYTDGSFFENTGEAGWAVVAIIHAHGTRYWGASFLEPSTTTVMFFMLATAIAVPILLKWSH